MFILASATTDKLRQVPVAFWINAAIGVFGFIGLVIVIRKLREINKIVLAIGLLFFFALVGFHWIYERNEPRFLTPVIDLIAPFFPSKGKH